jgi:ribosomal protein L34E
MMNVRVFDSGSGSSCDAPCSDRANSHCDLCGKPMQCGIVAGKNGCWCAQLPQVIPVSDNPHAKCLCPQCLMDQIRAAFRDKEGS